MEVVVMPIYEYRCVDCGHEFETIQQFSDPDPDRCPDCGRAEVRRLVSRSNFALKGGGWFDDGYGESPGGESGSDDAASSTISESTDGGGEEAAAE